MPVGAGVGVGGGIAVLLVIVGGVAARRLTGRARQLKRRARSGFLGSGIYESGGQGYGFWLFRGQRGAPKTSFGVSSLFSCHESGGQGYGFGFCVFVSRVREVRDMDSDFGSGRFRA